MKKTLLFLVSILTFTALYFTYINAKKILPFYTQLTKVRAGTEVDLQNKDQKSAHYVGSSKCVECHKDEHKSWSSSRHPKMIQEIKKDPSVVVADFLKLPKDANFKLGDAVYTVGGKFKQRFMMRKDTNGTEDYVLGNYQWNVQTKKWQEYKAWKSWYKKAYPHDNQTIPTSRACDGCHFTGFMSTSERIEPGISCEACHGASSEHVKNPDSEVYKASMSDPIRQNEVCLQCHMRNRDIRLRDHNMSDIYATAVDYPAGYAPGKSLKKYKLPAPFTMGKETSEFYANGAAKMNRTQGNEFVNSIKSKHGITCINSHNPHTLSPTSTNNAGNDLCMKCHSFGSPIGPHQDNLETHTKHKHESKGSLCVECHMPRTGRHTGKSPITVRSHMFGFTTPRETLKYGMPQETNACFACHKERGMKTLQSDLENWGMVGLDKLN